MKIEDVFESMAHVLSEHLDVKNYSVDLSRFKYEGEIGREVVGGFELYGTEDHEGVIAEFRVSEDDCLLIEDDSDVKVLIHEWVREASGLYLEKEKIPGVGIEEEELNDDWDGGDDLDDPY